MQWVYAAGSSVKPRKRPTPAQQSSRKAVSSGFFSSLFSVLTPQRGPSPNPELVVEGNDREQEVEEQGKLLKITETSIVLAVFSAAVDVRLDSNLREELLRATKKNAPSNLKYELIYVRRAGCLEVYVCANRIRKNGKVEYDASEKEEQGFQATGTVFQGLRADISGYVFIFVYT